MDKSRRRALTLLTSIPLIGLGSCGGGYSSQHQEPRRQLLYTYYGCDNLQIPEVQDHTNCAWIFGWGDRTLEDNLILQLSQAHSFGLKIILALDLIFKDGDELRLRAILDMLQNMGLLKNLAMIYPFDEPDKTIGDPNEIARRISILRSVAETYPSLRGIPLGCIYGSSTNLPGLDLFDFISFDHYGVDIFETGEFDSLRSRLGPTQSIFLVPGVANPWREPLGDFVKKANSDDRVVGIFPFLYIDRTNPDNSVDLGVRSNGLLGMCREVGKGIKELG